MKDKSAKSAILTKVQRLRQQATRLEAIAEALPDDLPRPADEALWKLAMSL